MNLKSGILWFSLCGMFIVASCTKEGIVPTNDTTTTNASDQSKSTTFGKAGPSMAYSESFNATSAITFTNTGVFNPGCGLGNATHLGAAKYYFNQQVMFDENGNPIGSVPAPVNQFYGLQLSAAGINNLPNTVSAITFDKQGNSVWFTSNSGNVLTPVNATRVNFTAPLTIIGGTGKFAGACGNVTLTGYFDPTSPSQAAVMQSSGNISY